MSLNNIIKDGRKSKNLTIKELSERTGVTCSTIINIEKGYHNPTLKTLCVLCSTLDLDFEKLIKEREK